VTADWHRLALLATTVLGFCLEHWEAIAFSVLVVVAATVFIPRGDFMALIVCGAISGGLAIGRLSR
jgi:hypothetical protein